MLLRIIRTANQYWQDLVLRISWRDLPAITTHTISFLVGTLLIQPKLGPSSLAPAQVLIPLSKIKGLKEAVRFTQNGKQYYIAQATAEGQCLLLERSIKIWFGPGKEGFFAVPYGLTAGVLMTKLVDSPSLLLVETSETMTPCDGDVSKLIYD